MKDKLTSSDVVQAIKSMAELTGYDNTDFSTHTTEWDDVVFTFHGRQAIIVPENHNTVSIENYLYNVFN